MVLVTGSGCIFKNFSIFEGFNEATAVITWEDQGARNYYENVHFGGMGYAAKSAAAAGSACLLLTGGGEHAFQSCRFGLDTIARTVANTCVRLASATERNEFYDCMFSMFAGTLTTQLFVDANSSGSMLVYALFKRCTFHAAANMSGVATPAAAVAYHASQNGTILLDACTAHNTTDWAGADTPLVKLANMVTTNGDTGGEYVNNDAT